MARKKPQEPKKEQPAPIVVAEDRNRKSALRLLQRAISNGWQIPDEIMQQAPEVCARILNDDMSQSRDRLRAAEVLAAMVRDRINTAIALDKIERLDHGEATERVVISPEIQARARAIIAKRLGTDG